MPRNTSARKEADTLLEKKRDVGKNVYVTENSVIHRFSSLIYVDDGIFRHMHVLVLRHAWLF
jgi:hypothetical protein